MPTPPGYDEKANLLINWTKRKIRTHFSPTSDKFFSEGEIWWAPLGENIGSEINVPRRPVANPRHQQSPPGEEDGLHGAVIIKRNPDLRQGSSDPSADRSHG